jgi:Protein of unknown function (DUF3300)
MKQARAVSGYQIARQSIALTLSVLIIPLASGNLNAQGGYAPLDAPGLDQLVAPIALYPDPLVAQILTAATYPQQVSDANNWSHQTAGLPPQQRADIANGMPWDPSVKALTAFPSVLDNMARNANWSTQLGNAYYNQPGDVMNAVQAARVQAQQAGYLRSTPQQRVYYDGGQILIAPVNPALVYVPYYDPWRIYGVGWVSPYAGFYVGPPPVGFALGLGLGFAAVGISIGLFAHYGWGFNSWAPNWRGGPVFYNHAAYYSRSATVYNHGNFGGYNRGVFEHAGRGVPANFHPGAAREGFARGAAGDRGINRGGVAARAGGGRPESRPLTLQHSPAARAQAAGRAEGARPAARAEGARPAARAEGARPAARAEGARPAARAAAPAHAAPGRAAAPAHAAAGHAAPAARGGGGEHGHK